ncbi:heme ABC exporter ATP-binding protein CcmA [Streptomyces muensis]|uniref:Heme ABC exporter ATP-binding protein CcmA n=1 Tax=Streptomyces muensis TaxID=1077944 RepID=A0A9X1Q4F6_STRM4|nr:heme ABC exporter ATP-binding protein CcmA [Streptomyces muensis]MCF1598463.1 heme ABC exporter ATP-binding protein CcmA [Streptomyces muensis]
MALLDVSGLWYRYPRSSDGEDGVLRGADAHIEEGESVGIVGRNGSGKSTLLKVLANLLQPTSGELRFHGRPVKPNDHEYRSALNYCAGAPQGFYPRLTATENVRFFSGMKGRMLSSTEAVELLERVVLAKSADVKYAKFSLGMRQRLHLACLLLEPSAVWILDEPTTGLDREGVQMLEGILAEAHDKTRIIVSHDADFLSRVTTRTLALEEGVLTCSVSSSS